MTTPSFSITKEMRLKVANQLTQKAISRHGKRIAAALEKVNQIYWNEHAEKVNGILPATPTHMAGLIQSGIVSAVCSVEPKAENKCLITIGYSQHRASESGQALAWGLMMTSPDYAGVARFMVRDRYYRDQYVLNFISPSGSVPRLNGMELIDETGDIADRCKKIRKDIVSVIDAAVDFHGKTTDILNSCRTSKQLIELFPEAAKLLPQPARKNTSIAPVELVQSVQAMLKSGVPSK